MNFMFQNCKVFILISSRLLFLKALIGLPLNIDKNNNSIEIQSSLSFFQLTGNTSIYENDSLQAATNSLYTINKNSSFSPNQVLKIANITYLPSLNSTKIPEIVLDPSFITYQLTNYTSGNTKIISNYYHSSMTVRTTDINDTFFTRSNFLIRSQNISLSQVSSNADILLSDKNKTTINFIKLLSSTLTVEYETKIADISLQATYSKNLQENSQPVTVSIAVEAVSSTLAPVNLNFNKDFFICQPQENVCLNNGACYMSSTSTFCICTKDFIGSFCETEAVNGLETAIVWLATTCGGLLLAMIITSYLIHIKLNKAQIKQKKLDDELGLVKKQRLKLIADFIYKQNQFFSSKYSFNESDYHTPHPYKQNLSDTSSQNSIFKLDTKGKEKTLFTDVDGDKDNVEQQNSLKNCRITGTSNVSNKTRQSQPNILHVNTKNPTDLNLHLLINTRYDSKYKPKQNYEEFSDLYSSKSLEILNTPGLSPLSKQFLKSKSEADLFIGFTQKESIAISTCNFSRNKKIPEFVLSKNKQKGIWAQEQERKRDCFT